MRWRRLLLAAAGYLIVGVVAYVAGISGYDHGVMWLLMGAAAGGVLVGAS